MVCRPVCRDSLIRAATFLLISTVAWSVTLVTRQAVAVNLVMNFNSGATEAPAFDPDGSKLQVLFDFAESHYEGVFEDSHTLTIDFWYDTLDGNTIGKHSLEDQNAVIFGGTYRENRGSVRIDTDVNWFIDPTPFDHSEFNMQQTLWRDISVSQRDDWYNYGADVPDTFEVGYTGQATGSGGASGMTDMLSVIMHEVGHALGMSSSNFGTMDETDTIPILGGENDGDYDFHSSWVFGKSLAVETANNSGDDNQNIAHLENTFTLLTPSIPGSIRRLPSHTDLMAMAAGQSYGDLDIPRREYYGGTNWNHAGNWTGNEVPETGDDVFVRAAQGAGVSLRAGLTADGTGRDLLVAEGGIVDTNAFKLDLTGDATVNDASNIYINGGGELEAGVVTINDGGQVRMTGGTLDVNRLEIEAGGSLEIDQQGTGVIEVQELLRNDGLIDTDLTDGLPSTLTFVATGGGSPWDLDGDDGDGFVRANDGDILFNSGGMADSFDGEIEVGPGFRFHFAEAWTNKSGLLDLNGGTSSSSPAKITGGKLTFNGGELNADTTGQTFAQIDAAIDITGGSIVVGEDDRLLLAGDVEFSGGDVSIGTGGEVQVDGSVRFVGNAQFNMTGATTATGHVDLNGPVAFDGGTFLFQNGVVQTDGQVSVNDGTVVTAGVFDLDGSGGASTTWTVNKQFSLAADQVDTSNNTFNGTLNINNPGNPPPGTPTGGEMMVNLYGDQSWTIAGTVNIVGLDPVPRVAAPTVFSGSDLTLAGTTNVEGAASSAARITLTGDMTLLNSDSSFVFRGGGVANPNRIEGGLVSGDGRLTSLSAGGLVGFGQIESEVAFLDGALLADDGVLEVSAANLLFADAIGTADVDGVLAVEGDLDSLTIGAVQMAGGVMNVGSLTNGSQSVPRTISGFGTINAQDFTNNGTVAAQGGVLTLVTQGFQSLGRFESTQLEALSGDLLFQPGTAPLPLFHGNARIGAGHSLTLAGAVTVSSLGRLSLEGGAGAEVAVVDATSIEMQGELAVPGHGSVQSNLLLRTGATVTMNGRFSVLRLAEITTIESGVSFVGGGAVINESAAELTLKDGAAIDSQLINDGALHLDQAPGTATLSRFVQSATGMLSMKIAGTTPGSQYDVLSIDTVADLEGELSIELVNDFSPSRTDEFSIITAGVSVAGQFSTLNLPAVAEGYEWTVDYLADSVVLGIVEALRGDFNLDGTVDAIDYAVWREGLGGLFNTEDYTDWRANYGATAPTGAQASVPEPASVTLLLLAGLGWMRRRG